MHRKLEGFLFQDCRKVSVIDANMIARKIPGSNWTHFGTQHQMSNAKCILKNMPTTCTLVLQQFQNKKTAPVEGGFFFVFGVERETRTFAVVLWPLLMLQSLPPDGVDLSSQKGNVFWGRIRQKDHFMMPFHFTFSRGGRAPFPTKKTPLASYTFYNSMQIEAFIPFSLGLF